MHNNRRDSILKNSWHSELIALLASFFLTLVCNQAFLTALLDGRDARSPHVWLLILDAGVAITALHWFLLLFFVNYWTIKPLLTALFVLTSFAVYFMDNFHVYLDRSMLRNVVATDVREVTELLHWRMLLYLLFYGFVPSALVWYANLSSRSWRTALRWRVGCGVLAFVLAGVSIWSITKEAIPLFREKRELRYLITPENYITSLIWVMAHSADAKEDGARSIVGADAHPSPAVVGRKPRVLVLVVGEAVRAANWGLNGYARQTTPQLQARHQTYQILNFSDATSCGTSTEVSLPCMFSPNGRHAYDEDQILSSESLLHVLARAGVAVLWRDNQSGCKGVCAGLPSEEVSGLKLDDICPRGRCFDAVLLHDLREKIDAQKGDFLIVLHMMGNHGPAYDQRYPDAFRRWKPICDSVDLARCEREAIVNSYDNAILYTDTVLAQTIDTLAAVTSHDVGLLYISDHGESLGEHNFYLHGLPYAIAPKEQTQIPMVLWFSSGLTATLGLNRGCLAARATEPVSHDYLFSTLLHFFDIETRAYERDWDFLASCTHSLAQQQ